VESDSPSRSYDRISTTHAPGRRSTAKTGYIQTWRIARRPCRVLALNGPIRIVQAERVVGGSPTGRGCMLRHRSNSGGPHERQCSRRLQTGSSANSLVRCPTADCEATAYLYCRTTSGTGGRRITKGAPTQVAAQLLPDWR
jgi:hypothetical protein